MSAYARYVLIGLTLLIAADSSWAHHSFTNSSFDLTQKITLVGKLVRVDWRNPHIQIGLEVKGNGTKAQTWLMEGMAPNALRSRNVSKSDFQECLGQTVTVEMVRHKNGSSYGLLLQITFPSGRSVGLAGWQPLSEGKGLRP